MMPPMIRLTVAILTILVALGCSEQRTAEEQRAIDLRLAAEEKRAAEEKPTAEEEVLFSRLTRDPFMVIESWERDDNKHLVVTTRQGHERYRYVFKPAQIDEKKLGIHLIDDRSVLVVGESDQLGTGPQPTRSGRLR